MTDLRVKIPPEDLKVYDKKGKLVSMINGQLALDRGVQANLPRIRELHLKRHELELKMEKAGPGADLPSMDEQYDKIESELQAAWNFPPDSRYFRFWDRPQCTCPKLDNNDRYPTGFYIRRVDCPVHGPRMRTEIKER